MMSEIIKMQEFHHTHVMSLIGVCMDAGAGVSVVMPYMANGSLLDYLKKERGSLELDIDSEIDQVSYRFNNMCTYICMLLLFCYSETSI